MITTKLIEKQNNDDNKVLEILNKKIMELMWNMMNLYETDTMNLYETEWFYLESLICQL